MSEKFEISSTIPPEDSGKRLDQVAAQLFPDYSRARLQQWIKSGDLLIDGKTARSRDKVLGGEVLELSAQEQEQTPHTAEVLELPVVYEDAELVVINKPVGLVVHPAAGNYSGTLLNGLLHQYPELKNLPRAGIVHRLDKDTSGLMVVARTLNSHQSLVAQLQDRTVSREYLAVVHGLVTAGGKVDAPLGRHPVNRKKRAVMRSHDAKEAITHYRLEQKFRSHTLLRLKLETGRTHQIRVHMAHIGFPLVGDQTYGGRLKLPKGASPALITFLQRFKRQALHAQKLGLVHPGSDEFMEWECPIPDDMQSLLDVLTQDESLEDS